MLKGMFWQICPDEVMVILADRTNVERENWWITKKEEMVVATGRTWTSYEWSCGAWHARKNRLKEYWQIVVNDGPIPSDAINLNAIAQSKAVFSFAKTTVMDNICGWEEEQKWEGSFFAVCMWFNTEGVSNDEHNCTQDHSKRRMLTIMESVNWVCEEALEQHEWVSPLTLFLERRIVEGS